MPGTPVLHFSGRFRFQNPAYNNDPGNGPIRYDPSTPRDEVITICGCNPSRYCDFRFEDVAVNLATYADGTTDDDSDPAVGQPLVLKGFLVDVSPSSINARLFAGRLGVGTALDGWLDPADQSDPRLSIRPLGGSDETIAAHYETRFVINNNVPISGSRYFEELGERDELEIYFQLNHWTLLENQSASSFERLTGDVYGYLRPKPPAADADGLRLSNRLLITHPKLDYRLTEFVVSPSTSPPDISVSDIDGTYDLLREEQLVALRYLDFIPFLDRDRQTADVDSYLVSLQNHAGDLRYDLGMFDGDVPEMRKCGGLVHLGLPKGVDVDGLWLVIEAIKNGQPLPLVRESEWDLQLLPLAGSNRERTLTPRGVVLPFGGSIEIRVKAFRHNRPAAFQTVRCLPPDDNGRSPVVNSFTAATAMTGADGVATLSVQSKDIRCTSPRHHRFSGEDLLHFPMDRFFGNPLIAQIDNPGRRFSGGVEQVKIAVRVLHEIRPADMPAVPSFERDIKSLFSYHTRYFPWLHVRDDGKAFDRFLDLDNLDDFCAYVDLILHRLELDQNERHKMPRTRDFPIGGIDLIRRWKDTGMSP
jgi:hypothetical protein